MTLVLWQTEWCPASRRVRQRLTELGLEFVARQVPADPDERAGLLAATGQSSIPALADGDELVVGSAGILEHLEHHYAEPAGAEGHRARAARARRRDLEEACRQLQVGTR